MGWNILEPIRKRDNRLQTRLKMANFRLDSSSLYSLLDLLQVYSHDPLSNNFLMKI